jgi:hypothetical protein
MANNPPSFRRPSPITKEMVHPEAAQAINNNTDSCFDLQNALVAVNTKVEALKTAAASSSSSSGSSSKPSAPIVSSFSGQGTVNNQTGSTSYATQSSDNGAMIVLDDSSPVAVALNSTATAPFYCFITNIGTGLVTLTPTNGVTVNGAASFPLPQNYTSLVVFSFGVWWASAMPIVPQTFNAVAHEFLKSYDSTTGIFVAGQPSFTDLLGIATTVQIGTGTPSAGQYVDGGTGAWTTLPGGLSVTITTAALTIGGTQGSQTFTSGRLTSQVQAT